MNRQWSLVASLMLIAAGITAAGAEKAVPAAEKPAAGRQDAVFEMKEVRPEDG